MGACYQHTNNILPSGGRLRAWTLTGRRSIDAARTDDVRRNPTDAHHQCRPLRGRSLAMPSKPLHRAHFLRGCSAIFVGEGEQQVIHPAASEVRPGRHLFVHLRALSTRVRWRRRANGALPPRGFPGLHQPGYVFRLFLVVAHSAPFRAHLPHGSLPSQVRQSWNIGRAQSHHIYNQSRKSQPDPSVSQ